MTTIEANEKVCPFIQQRGFVRSGLNHDNQLYQDRLSNDSRSANIKCICGDCMAWQWDSTYEKKTSNAIHGKEFHTPEGWNSLGYDKHGELWNDRTVVSNSSGHCSMIKNN